ncbi:ribonuclease E activity regulator RraA [Ramlibacter sp. AW1]|uniref:4-hydroxy-4-methyl-2-oxoglutarate aldolase n=1 Tax=Ramlibacter aurantiacus TaxID=2801330 RepID=A0A937D6N2_9BURK|nr:ribonuclease E activity regulator RraA [Ramlibacter aurantiacus]MBL0420036.1 ribonuclease E activity regulator RraA [Ramlibacter aurantiacus]
MTSTADLFDAHPDLVQVCEVPWRHFGRRRRFSGPCLPLWANEDHRPVLACLSRPGEGRVLVVDAGGSLRIGVLGDRLAGHAVRNGWAGVVIHGCIRDSATIDGMDIGIKALGTTARRSNVEREGSLERAVSFGGVSFEAGCWVYADEDAVVLSPRELSVAGER